MKLSLVFSTLASIVVLATAYPTQGPVAKRSNVEKREDLTSDLFIYDYHNHRKREELTSDLFIYDYHNHRKREELNSDLFVYDYSRKREELNSDLIGDVSKPESLEEGKREE